VVSEGEDGSMVVALEIRNRAAARGFLVSLLDRAEVLEPPELRRELIAWLERFGADRHVNEAAS
jgi:predicted DNA-binding transcriptional regulator YafY